MPDHRPAENATTNSWPYLGSLPTPEMLEELDRASPGAATAIFRLAEAEQQHRQAIERLDRRQQLLGMLLGFMLAVLLIALAAWLAARGQADAAAVVSIAGVGAVLAARILDRQEL